MVPPPKPERGTPYPPVLRKTGPHPPPVASARPRFCMEPRLNIQSNNQKPEGGGTLSEKRERVPPPPLQNKRGGPPPPLSCPGQGTTPPPDRSTEARFRVESRLTGNIRASKKLGGRYPVFARRGYSALPTPPLVRDRGGGGPPLFGKNGVLPLRLPGSENAFPASHWNVRSDYQVGLNRRGGFGAAAFIIIRIYGGLTLQFLVQTLMATGVIHSVRYPA